MKKVIRVTKVSEVKQDNGAKQEHRNYKTISFSTPSVEAVPDGFGGVIQAAVKPRETSINVYEKSYLDNKMEFGYDAKVGDAFLGDIVTRMVTPYAIPSNKEGEEDKIVNAYTTIVLGDTSSPNWESIVKATFRAKGHELRTPAPTNFSIARDSEADLANFESKKIVF